MSNFSLDTNSSSGDIISSLNYALANLGNQTLASTTANVVTANTSTGVLSSTSTNNAGYSSTTVVGYLYQYMDVAYATSPTGSSGFSFSPTNAGYYGLYNTKSSSANSTNPTNYIWTQVAGGFGISKKLYYQTLGGRQLNLYIGTSAPDPTWTLVPSGTPINLDTISVTQNNQVITESAYLLANTAPSTPSGGFYNFNTLTLTPPYLWSATIPSITANNNVYITQAAFVGNSTSNVGPATSWTTPSVFTTAFNGNTGPQGSRGFVPLGFVQTPSDPTQANTATLSSWFSASRSAANPPIGLGYTPIAGDTAQFFYANLFNSNYDVTSVQSFDGNIWANVSATVVSGAVIFPGTVTANALNVNSIYAITIQSTNASLGNTQSPGYWLQANTGSASFGGTVTIGNQLTVGTNANIGANVYIGANAFIGQNANIRGNAYIGNYANIQNYVNIGSNLTVGNNASIGKSLNVGDSAVIGDILTVGNNASIGYNLAVGNNASIGNNLTVGNNASIGNNLTVGNNTNIGTNLTVGANANIGNNLTVGANAYIGQNITIANVITLGALNANTVGTTQISQNSITTGKIQANAITGNLIAANTITGNNIVANSFQANTIFGGAIQAGTITTLQLAAGTITVANSIQSTNAVFGNYTSPGYWLDAQSGNVRMGGSVSVGNNLTVGSNAYFGSDANFGANINVAGLITKGNLQANVVTTLSIQQNAVTQTVYVQADSAVNTISWVNGNTTVFGQSGYLWPINTRGFGVGGGATIIPTNSGVGTIGVTGGQIQVTYNGYVNSATNSAYNVVELWKNNPSSYYNNSYRKMRTVPMWWLVTNATVNGARATNLPIIWAAGQNGALQNYYYDNGANHPVYPYTGNTWTSISTSFGRNNFNAIIPCCASTNETTGTPPDQNNSYIQNNLIGFGPNGTMYIRSENTMWIGQDISGNVNYNLYDGPYIIETVSSATQFTVYGAVNNCLGSTRFVGNGFDFQLWAGTPIPFTVVGAGGNIASGTITTLDRGSRYASAALMPSASINTFVNESSGTFQDLYDVYSNFTANIAPNYFPSTIIPFTTTSIAVGTGGVILSSSRSYWSGNCELTTTPSWSTQFSGVNTNLNSVFYGHNLWVAVGDAGVILTSPSGSGWTKRSSGVTFNLEGVTWNGYTWTVVGQSGVTLTSNNAINWTSIGTPASSITRDLYAVATVYNDPGIPVNSSGRLTAASGDEIIQSTLDPAVSYFNWSDSDPSTGYQGGVSYTTNLTRLQYFGSWSNIANVSQPPTYQQVANAQIISGTYTDIYYTANTAVTYYLVLGNMYGNVNVYSGGSSISVIEFKK